tara:strand:- start:14 stop:205 length:192 start_codon:yes stop_codon:yes gene_type:complete
MTTCKFIANEFGLDRKTSHDDDLFSWIDIAPNLGMAPIPEPDMDGPRAILIFIYYEHDRILSK